MGQVVTALPNYGRDYVHAGEGERIDFERRYFTGRVDPEWWQHLQSYQPWSTDEARKFSAQAYGLLTSHDHNLSDRDRLTRENCGACILNGYKPRGGWGDPELDSAGAGPNYSGWARVYLQARRAIPSAWRDAFARQGHDNRPYYDAIGRDLVTYGVRFTDNPQ